ncbi:hypothetical protein LD85_0993 [Saccharolobus islandicus L.D.8.5]|uniref:Uncharacterized protein n=1 Tax=Saccharolobus islandicus (strain L.D.8.5 / Lassen \|nr:hypothetical protein LD85_0993 [Sulfolobus islandicus L.D.8.5]
MFFDYYVKSFASLFIVIKAYIVVYERYRIWMIMKGYWRSP